MLRKINFTETEADSEGVRMIKLVTSTPRKRMIVRRGKEYILLRMEDVVLIHTENKMVYVTDRDGKKFIGEKNLQEVMDDLDPGIFFRTNRQYIVNIAFIKSFKSYEKVKLEISLTIPEFSYHAIIISQEMAPLFRKWIGS
jgi:DNA-binding LytR/AlgR family response regulator